MANPNAVGGIAYVKIDGVQLALKGNCKVQASTIKREMVVGMDGVHGPKEMFQAPGLEIDIIDTVNLEVTKLQDITDATITLELNNGKVYSLEHATTLEVSEVDVEEGNLTIKFAGKDIKEIV